MILVTGATGNVGRQVVTQLLETGAAVRALARNPETADLPDGAEVVRGDLSRPESLAATLDGVESVFLLWPLTTADGAPEVMGTIAKHARRVVYLSASSARDPEQQNGLPNFWGDVEQAIEKTGLEWTFLRPGGFAANTLGWAEQIRTEGIVRWPYGEAARSLIHERDIAAVAVAALTEDRHAGGKYHLTGPEVLTQIEQVRTIGEVIGRPLRWEELSREDARQQLLAAWGDPSFVELALDSWAQMVTEPEEVTSTFPEIIGRPARTFREWAGDHVADFRVS